MGEVGGGGTAASKACSAQSRAASGKERGAGGAQLAQEHGGAAGEEMITSSTFKLQKDRKKQAATDHLSCFKKAIWE